MQRRIVTPRRISRSTGHSIGPDRPVACSGRPATTVTAQPWSIDEILGEIGEQLTGRRLIWPVRSIEKTDVHAMPVRGPGRSALYHSIVRASPSVKSVVAEKPNAARARVTSRLRRGWPSGFVRSNTRRPLNPVRAAISPARSRMLISKPAPMFTGSADS